MWHVSCTLKQCIHWYLAAYQNTHTDTGKKRSQKVKKLAHTVVLVRLFPLLELNFLWFYPNTIAT